MFSIYKAASYGIRSIKHLWTITIALLTVLLLLQSLIIWGELNQQKIKIPDFVFQRIDDALSKQHLSLNASKRSLSMSGEIVLNDFGLYYKNQSDPIFSCERIKIELSLLPLLLGKVVVQEIVIDRGTLFTPSIFSPTGLHEAILENIFADTTLNKNLLSIQQLSCKARTLNIICSGNLDIENFKTNSDFKLIPFFQQTAQAFEKSYIINSFKEPILLVTPIPSETKSTNFDLTFAFDSFEYNNDVTLSNGFLRTFARINNNKLTLDKEVHIEAQSIGWRNQLLAESGIFKIQDLSLTPVNGTLPYPSKLHAILNNTTWQQEKNLSIDCEIDFSETPYIHPQVSITKSNQWLQADLYVDTSKKIVNIYSSGHAKIDTIENHLPYQIIDNKAYPELYGFINFRGSGQAQYQNNTSPFGFFEFKTWSNFVALNGEPFRNVYLEVNLTPEQLKIQQAFVESKDTYVQGSFTENFTTGHCRYLLAGQINPKHLDLWMNSWWTELWNEVTLHKEFPRANIDISGISSPEKHGGTQVFADILLEQFEYKGIPVKSTQMLLNSGPKWLELANIDGYLTHGSLKGTIRWDYHDLLRDNLLRMYINANTEIPLEQLDTILDNPDFHNLLKVFNCYKPPKVILDGAIYTNPEDNHFSISFNSESPLYFKKFPFDNLSFNADYTPKITTISDVLFGFARGKGTASVLFAEQDNKKDKASINVTLNNSHQDLAIKHIKEFFNQKQLRPDEESHYGGLINLSGRATGIIGDSDSYSGSGNFHVSEADFGKINLFGFISQLLSATPLGLGSFQLTDAESNILISDGKVHFPDLNIYGPSVNIKSEGNIDITTQDLNFIMDIDPLGRGKRPLLSQALLVLTPITQSFQVKLGGTIKEPKWNTSLTPLGLFKQKGIKPKKNDNSSPEN